MGNLIHFIIGNSSPEKLELETLAMNRSEWEHEVYFQVFGGMETFIVLCDYRSSGQI